MVRRTFRENMVGLAIVTMAAIYGPFLKGMYNMVRYETTDPEGEKLREERYAEIRSVPLVLCSTAKPIAQNTLDLLPR